MSELDRHPHHTSLDPDDWESMRRLGHRMVDDMLDYLRDLRERPVWQRVPQSVRENFTGRVPIEPEGAEAAYNDFVKNVLPYPLGNIHPRFWGWVNGSGTPLGALAEFLAATMNSNIWSPQLGASFVEKQVLSWCREMLGFPEGASGVLVSGGSMANLVGLAVARKARAEFDVLDRGQEQGRRRMMTYTSSQAHYSIHKAIELMGLGRRSIREIEVRADFSVDVAAMREAIETDLAEGRLPFCIVANAGTVGTGAIDDIASLADLAAEHGLWLHVDGAFGAIAAISPKLRPLLSGMERADSLAFDFHKWMHMPIEVGCVLVRDEEAHRSAFSTSGIYLSALDGGIAYRESPWFSEYGIQLTRGFRALKVWLSMKEHGLRRFIESVEENVEQARYLASLIERDQKLELQAPVTLNIVCFRYRGGIEDESRIDAVNREILIALQESGEAVPSHTSIGGRFSIRACITNHRSVREDFDFLVRRVIDLGDAVRSRDPAVPPGA